MTVDLERSSGVQLHITSLPGGRLGSEAYRFVDWLAAAGQSWWQVLPLGPPDRYRSPYKSASAFAAWPGFLAESRAPVSAAEIADFRERHAYWIGGWERFSSRGAVADQVRFEREWGALRRYAAERGVRILGDVAIYVSPGGADHRTWPELFRRDAVAGVPPDAYSATGQLWGNPLYDWPAVRRRGYRWWVERVRRTLELFDTARIDHFRGLVAYWAVPRGARSAAGGRWRRGPGTGLFRALERELAPRPTWRRAAADRSWSGPLHVPLVAEDLGVITAPVERLRAALRLPGMLAVQFGMEPDEPESVHRLENHTADRIVYTATHDQDTLRGWLDSLPDAQRAFVLGEVARHGVAEPRAPWWGLIRYTFSSPARVAMVQAQDVLGLGSQARMNQPGRAGSSWRWQMEPGALTPALGRRLRAATEEAGRLPAGR
ncbi:MAG TPA: 4-alpha-glucanotransferase [Solirubrobacteraceae bacterium]|nr:4-alpha-glucanotransferase [Solirubrobacteraceae bacterium]